MESAVWGLIGTVVGALTSIGTTWMASHNSTKLQKQADLDGRVERIRAFQRETLLELQEALHDALRLMSRAYIEDCASYEKTGNWASSRLSEEVNEGIRLAQRRVAIFTERVADDSLRMEIKNLMKLGNEMLFAHSRSESGAALDQLTLNSIGVLEKLGIILRNTYF